MNGHVDSFNGRTIVGWVVATNRDQPVSNADTELIFFVNNIRVGSAIPTISRPDILELYPEAKVSGFIFEFDDDMVPAKDFTINVRRKETLEDLPGSPLVVHDRRAPVTSAHIDSCDTSGINAWATIDSRRVPYFAMRTSRGISFLPFVRVHRPDVSRELGLTDQYTGVRILLPCQFIGLESKIVIDIAHQSVDTETVYSDGDADGENLHSVIYSLDESGASKLASLGPNNTTVEEGTQYVSALISAINATLPEYNLEIDRILSSVLAPQRPEVLENIVSAFDTICNSIDTQIALLRTCDHAEDSASKATISILIVAAVRSGFHPSVRVDPERLQNILLMAACHTDLSPDQLFLLLAISNLDELTSTIPTSFLEWLHQKRAITIGAAVAERILMGPANQVPNGALVAATVLMRDAAYSSANHSPVTGSLCIDRKRGNRPHTARKDSIGTSKRRDLHDKWTVTLESLERLLPSAEFFYLFGENDKLNYYPQDEFRRRHGGESEALASPNLSIVFDESHIQRELLSLGHNLVFNCPILTYLILWKELQFLPNPLLDGRLLEDATHLKGLRAWLCHRTSYPNTPRQASCYIADNLFFAVNNHLNLSVEIPPLIHYLSNNLSVAGNPNFDDLGYQLLYGEYLSEKRPLHHYVTIGNKLGYSPRPSMGAIQCKPNANLDFFRI